MHRPPAVPLVVPSRDRRVDLMDIIRREFQNLPTLALTVAQACRLWAMEPSTARDVLEALVGEGSLRRRLDGRYSSSARMAVA